jgi:hypothetical protein
MQVICLTIFSSLFEYVIRYSQEDIHVQLRHHLLSHQPSSHLRTYLVPIQDEPVDDEPNDLLSTLLRLGCGLRKLFFPPPTDFRIYSDRGLSIELVVAGMTRRKFAGLAGML